MAMGDASNDAIGTATVESEAPSIDVVSGYFGVGRARAARSCRCNPVLDRAGSALMSGRRLRKWLATIAVRHGLDVETLQVPLGSATHAEARAAAAR